MNVYDAAEITKGETVRKILYTFFETAVDRSRYCNSRMRGREAEGNQQQRNQCQQANLVPLRRSWI